MAEISKEKMDEIIYDFKRAGPWSGTIAQRKEKFANCFARLCEASGLDVDGWIMEFDIPNTFREWTNSGNSSVSFLDHKVVMRGRLSVVTLLHEFGHIYLRDNQLDNDTVQDFAVKLFEEYFPEKMTQLDKDPETGMLKKRQ